MSKPTRLVGIELGSGRRTAVVALDYFPEQGKVFVHSIRTNFESSREENKDEQLISHINSLAADSIGVDAPLSLPPCMQCTLPSCPSFGLCEVDQVRWMREQAARAGTPARPRYASPYSRRPVDFLLRGAWQTEAEFPVDESFGAARAPLAAHMQYLKRHFKAASFLEVIPRLALSGIAEQYGIYPRELRRSRDVEEGVENRLNILEKWSGTAASPRVPNLFLYNAELQQLAQELNVFDALLCAWMVLYEKLGLLEEAEFNPAWGRVAKPIAINRAPEIRPEP